jgi:chemotaxis protein MotC
VIRSAMHRLAMAFAILGLAVTQGHGDETETKPIDIRPPAEVKAPFDNKSPVEIVRSLNALQDQVVQGNFAAQAALPRVIAQMGERLLGADPQSWRQVKNVRALVTYTLSGGQARVIRRVLELGTVPETEKKLMEGSLAFVEGREAKAKQLLMDIDAKSLTPTVAGHLALVQALLISHENPHKSTELLDLARVLAPGTLVEETALRREIFSLSEGDGEDSNKFVLLSSQYLRRFQNSVYAENFRQRFSAAITHFGLVNAPDQFGKLAKLIADLETDDQLRLYMLIAQGAILDGNVAMARIGAEKALAITKDGGTDAVRATLYAGTALILTNNYDEGLAKLKELDVSQLPKHEAELKNAVLSIAKQIRKWPDLPVASDDEPKLNLQAPGRDGTATAGADPVIGLAQKAISDTDQLLREEVH